MATRTGKYKDYYEILGVPEAAGETEIKKSFRKLALAHHPDHNPGKPQSEEKFKEITEAYGVLVDPRKRGEYDRFRADYLSGAYTGDSEFRYSQKDIFESMFRDGFAREMFEELNREFHRSGYRSGNHFFQTIFFGGAVGGLGRILQMIPGPIGKIGLGLKIAQMAGASLLAYNRMRKMRQTGQPGGDQAQKNSPNVLDSLKGVFQPGNQGPVEPDAANMILSLTIPESEAKTGIQKKITYKVGGDSEVLMVRIPANFPSGGKLRIQEKGFIKDGKRGDLILQIKVENAPTLNTGK